MHDPIEAALGVQGRLLLQRSQSFEYRDQLELDCDYSFTVDVHRDPTSADVAVLHATVVDRSGATVVVSETALCIMSLGLPTRTPRPLPPPPKSPIPDLRVGPIDRMQTQRYALASLDNNPLHADTGAGRAIGLQGPIVHGMLVMGQFERAIAAWRRDLQIRRLHGRFVQPLPIDSGIILNTRVAGCRRQGDGERLVLRLIARTDQDAAICVGEVEAHAAVPASNGHIRTRG